MFCKNVLEPYPEIASSIGHRIKENYIMHYAKNSSDADTIIKENDKE
jgi:hypothetical protein